MDNVTVCVEKLLEQEVDEISKSGEEKYIKPPTFSEELTYLSGKIDFYEGILKADNENEDDQNDSKKEAVNANEVQQWHWESVHSKLRVALSEVSVMLDVLQCLSRKKYLVLDPIQQNAEPNKQTVQMLEKRKYLARAGAIISKGALSLKKEKAFDSTSFGKDYENEYYVQLMHLRQYWHVKKVGSLITGSLSYRNAGSKFWHPGLFEVKPDHDDSPTESVKKLSVNISADLVPQSKLIINITDNVTRSYWKTSYPSQFNLANDNRNWNLKLKEAQMNLFNKELFAHLCNDAFQGSFTGIDILDGKINCKIFDDVIVTMENYVENEKLAPKNEPTLSNNNPLDLELVLNNLLLKYHSLNAKWNNPSPSTSNNYQRISRSSSIHNMVHRKIATQPASLLKSFLDAVTFKIILNRVKKYFEMKCLENLNPILLVHWNLLNTPLNSSVNITLQTKFECQIKSKSLILFISADKFTLLSEDATKYQVSPTIECLSKIINWFICSHLVEVAKLIAAQSGWHVKQCNSKYIAEDDITNVGLTFYKTKTKQHILMKVFNENSITVKVSCAHKNIEAVDYEFESFCQKFQHLSWDDIHGKFFVEKCKSLFIATI